MTFLRTYYPSALCWREGRKSERGRGNLGAMAKLIISLAAWDLPDFYPHSSSINLHGFPHYLHTHSSLREGSISTTTTNYVSCDRGSHHPQHLQITHTFSSWGTPPICPLSGIVWEVWHRHFKTKVDMASLAGGWPVPIPTYCHFGLPLMCNVYVWW